MIHLITGGSGSGKSAYAEDWLVGEENIEDLCALGQQHFCEVSPTGDVIVSGNSTNLEQKYLYIATMRPYGEETLAKIQRHQRLRAGKGFETWECYGQLACAEPVGEKREHISYGKDSGFQKYAGILLECMSNHLANLLYTEEGQLRNIEEVRKEVLDGIAYLETLSDRIAIVTNEIHSDTQAYSEETLTYIQLLGEINQALGECAEKITEVVYGIPVCIKK